MAQDKHKDNIREALEMVNLTKECWKKAKQNMPMKLYNLPAKLLTSK